MATTARKPRVPPVPITSKDLAPIHGAAACATRLGIARRAHQSRVARRPEQGERQSTPRNRFKAYPRAIEAERRRQNRQPRPKRRQSYGHESDRCELCPDRMMKAGNGEFDRARRHLRRADERAKSNRRAERKTAGLQE